MITVISLILTGGIVGVLSGLLGIGGGLVLVSALLLTLPAYGVGQSEIAHVAVATSLATTVITAMVSTFKHHQKSGVLWPTVRSLAPGLIVGSILGASIATKIDGFWLVIAVSVYCMIAAIQINLGSPSPSESASQNSLRSKSLAIPGVGIGVVSAIVGIGGGSMTVPMLAKKGAEMVRAVGTSTACGFLVALFGALAFALGGESLQTSVPGTVGYVHVEAALALAVGSIFMVPYGVKLAHRMSGNRLKIVFSCFLVVLGITILATNLG